MYRGMYQICMMICIELCMEAMYAYVQSYVLDMCTGYIWRYVLDMYDDLRRAMNWIGIELCIGYAQRIYKRLCIEYVQSSAWRALQRISRALLLILIYIVDCALQLQHRSATAKRDANLVHTHQTTHASALSPHHERALYVIERALYFKKEPCAT